MEISISVEENYIVLPKLGTKIAILSNGRRNKIFFVRDVYIAEFPTDDVDFQIQVDNTKCNRNIRITLEVNKTEKQFKFEKGKKYEPIETLTSGGNKLHFRGQDSHEGQQIVIHTAQKHNISYDVAVVMCSQIKFSVEVEAGLEQVFKNMEQEPNGRRVVISAIWSTMDNKVEVSVGEYNTVAYLKQVISENSGRRLTNMNIVYQGRYLNDNDLIIDCGVQSDSSIIIEAIEEDYREVTDAISFPATNLGARGAICLGDKTSQTFKTFSNFENDTSFNIRRFTVELRMAPRYAAL